MKNRQPKQEILQIILPKVRAEILRVLFTAPKKPRYMSELARLSGASFGTMHEELANLMAAGILSSRSNGYKRFYWPNQNHALFQSILNMVHTAGRLPAVDISKLRRIERRRVRKPKSRPPRYYSGSTYPLRWGIITPDRK